MNKKDIVARIEGILEPSLVKSIAEWMDSEERLYIENLALKDKVELLEKKLRSFGAVEHKDPISDQIKRELKIESLRGRSKYMFNLEEDR